VRDRAECIFIAAAYQIARLQKCVIPIRGNMRGPGLPRRASTLGGPQRESQAGPPRPARGSSPRWLDRLPLAEGTAFLGRSTWRSWWRGGSGRWPRPAWGL